MVQSILYLPLSVPSPDRVMRAPQALLGDCSGLSFSITVSSQPHVPLLGLSPSTNLVPCLWGEVVNHSWGLGD